MTTMYTKPKRTTTHPLRTARRDEATKQAAKREKLSPRQQLNRLDRRLGKGQGAAKERTRLSAAAAVARQKVVKAAIKAAVK